MLKLTPTQIKDFRLCERLYDYRHIQKLSEPTGSRDLLSIRFENTIKNIVNYYFYKKQGGMPPSYASLLNRWQKLWFPKDTTAYDIIHEKHESHYGNNASLTTRAADILMKLVENFSDPLIIPMAIDYDFIVPINETICLEDRYDLIYNYKRKNYAIKWAFNIKYKDNILEDVKTVTELVAMQVAFRSKYGNKIDETQFGYYDLMVSKPFYVGHKVSKEHFDAVLYWTSLIEEEEVFASKRGLINYCKTCPFNKPCSEWKNWKKQEA